MAQTEDLMRLTTDFPDAFANPEAPRPSVQSPAAHPQESTQQLLELMQEFPHAFADPEAPSAQQEAGEGDSSPREPAITEKQTSSPVPPGYAPALRRRVQTMAWGAIDFSLTYGERGLTELWITAGKSGTEVQSLCEAIARLINLLLAHRVSIPAIVREIRGIRGADSEGLGPHRFLGIADLIGKVLQEAPPVWEASVGMEPVPVSEAVEPQPRPSVPETAEVNGVITSNLIPDWSADSASLCPDCGAELQQANGCKGGACLVCGYSSCS